MNRKVLCIGLVFLILVSITGCASNTPAPAADAPADAPAAEAPAGTIKVALMAPLTGNMANIGVEFKQGAELRAKQVNDAGGINGKMVEIVYFDDKMDPKEAANIAQLIVNNQEIVAVVGSYTSSACFAAIPIFDPVSLSMVTPSASNPDLTKDNDVLFKMWTGFDVYAPMIADLAVTELGKKNLGVIYVFNDWGIGVKDYFVERATELGATIVAEEVLYDGDKDFKTQLTNIKAQNPDALVILTYFAEGGIIVQQAKALGIDVQYIGSGTLVDSQFVEMTGSDAEGIYVVNEFVADDPRPSVQKFVEEYKAVFEGELPGNYQGNSYDALGAILHAYQTHGETREAVNQGLHNLEDFQGIGGPLTFKGQEIIKPQVFVQLRDGQWRFFKESPVE